MVRENCQRVYNHQITNKQSTDCLKNGLYENLIHKQLSIISFLACARTYAILERIFDDQFVSVGVVKLSIIGEKSDDYNICYNSRDCTCVFTMGCWFSFHVWICYFSELNPIKTN